jgi:hypothetical protein
MRVFFSHFPNSNVIGSVIDPVFVIFLKFIKNLLLFNFRLILVEALFFELLIEEKLFMSIFQKIVKYVSVFFEMKVSVDQRKCVSKIKNVSSRVDQNVTEVILLA